MYQQNVVARWMIDSPAPSLHNMRTDTLLQRRERRMEIHWINVGEGDCILILFDNGKAMVVDIDIWQPLGGDELEDAIEYLRKKLPKRNGNPWIDLLVSTHPHRDHGSGIAMALREFGVGEVWESGHRLTGEEAEEEWYQELIKALEKAGAKTPKASSKAIELIGDGVRVWVLAPTKSLEAASGETGKKDIHDECMVLRIEDSADNSVILASDSRVNGWRDSIVPTFGSDGHDLLSADLFQGPHHGSRSFFRASKDENPYLDGLNEVSPDTVVISVGPNKHEHPHKDALELYEKDGRNVMRTDQEGTIVAKTTSGGWEVGSDESDLKAGIKAGAVAVGVGGKVTLPGRGKPPTKPHRNWGCHS